MLSIMFKGRTTNFPDEPEDLGFSAFKMVPVVRTRILSYFLLVTLFTYLGLTFSSAAGVENWSMKLNFPAPQPEDTPHLKGLAQL